MDLETLKQEVEKGLHDLKEAQSQKMDAIQKETEIRLAEKISEAVEKITTLSAEQKSRLDTLEKMINRSNFKSDSEYNDQKSELDAFLRKGEGAIDNKITIKAMTSNDDANGGVLVTPNVYKSISTRIFESSPMRQLAQVESGSDAFYEVLLDDDEVGARWVSEGSSQGETNTPQTGVIKIEAHEMEAEPRISRRLLQDSAYDVPAWLERKLVDKFGRVEATAYFTGNAVGQPKGILSYSEAANETYTRDALQVVNSGNASALTVDGLIALQNALKEGYQPNASWVMKRSTFGQILLLKSTNNYHFLGLQPTDRGGYSMNILGRPVSFADAMPAVASNAKSIAYGDFRLGYLIYDRMGMDIVRDDLTAKGWVKFYTTRRVGGGVQNFEAIKLQKIAS